MCGFNAYHDLGSALADAKAFMSTPTAKLLRSGSLVVGMIAGRGDVEIHKDGFRCEKAQILALAPISFGPYPLYSGRELLANMDPLYRSIPIYDRAHQLENSNHDMAITISKGLRPVHNWGRHNYGLLLRLAPLLMFSVCLGAWCLFQGWSSVCWGGVFGCIWGMFYSLRADLQRDTAFPSDWKQLF